MNPLPDYFSLLMEAQYSSEQVDRFDVRSENLESAKQFEELCSQANGASIELVEYVMAHGPQIIEHLRMGP